MRRLAWPLRPLPDGRGEVWRWDLGGLAELPAARAALRSRLGTVGFPAPDEDTAAERLVLRYRPLGRKGLLRELALSELDPNLFERPKAGFELPLEAWCRKQLGDDIDATLRDEALCNRVAIVFTILVFAILPLMFMYRPGHAP